MTAAKLAALLDAEGVRLDYSPGAFGGDGKFCPPGTLGVTGEVPPHLYAASVVLRTGLAAIVSGRCWYMLTATGLAVRISTSALIPAAAKFLAVGDVASPWGRIAAMARLDLPHLFDPSAANNNRGRSRADGVHLFDSGGKS